MTSPRRQREDEHWMRQALALADQAAALGEVPVGAVIVRAGQCLGSGHNRSVIDTDPSAHAEVVALRAAASATGSWRLDGATLYVTIEPCLMCCGAILQARIKRLVFGAREPRTGAVVSAFDTVLASSNLHHVAVTDNVLREESSARILRFFQQRRQRGTESQ